MKKKKEPSIVWLIVPIPLAVILFMGMQVIRVIMVVTKNGEEIQKITDNVIFRTFQIAIPILLILFWIIYLIYYCIKKNQK